MGFDCSGGPLLVHPHFPYTGRQYAQCKYTEHEVMNRLMGTFVDSLE